MLDDWGCGWSMDENGLAGNYASAYMFYKVYTPWLPLSCCRCPLLKEFMLYRLPVLCLVNDTAAVKEPPVLSGSVGSGRGKGLFVD